ncbi:U-box domain-containing protein 27-like isoform X2 [Oryza brachyantha]|uniref:U-box domain-containing protein 27-like isoform X2 n=1 Tax=Oryza brachyantha TaxID=4533 RepID=UPI001ADAE5E3|nr:U-box domain-containing protein 27-like isoform X2 [Oryza brachyantha]
MVRKESTTSMRLPPQHQGLEVKIPSFFRCPISLNVMRSPVSLCTGVTYDRASIQRWLDSGNNTCPATMLPLPSTDLVPNLTLRSLIAHWSASAASSSPAAGSVGSGAGPSPACLVRQVASSDADPSTALRALAAYLSDDDVDEFEKNTLVGAGGAAETVASVLRRKGEQQISVEGAEAAVRVLAATVALDGIEDANKKRVAAGLAADASASAASLARVLRGGSGLEARIDAARLVEFLLANAAGEAKEAIAESSELVGELIRLVGPVDEKGSLDMKAVDTGLSCLATISRSRRAARAEAAVAVLWAVCHKYKDRRAADAAAASEGGLTRLLLLLQSGCSPAARQMALELLKIYKVNAKSCLAGYDSKTTHIMPF